MGQRVIIDSNNNVRIIDSGPIGPAGPGGEDGAGENNDIKVVSLYLPPELDLTGIGGIEAIYTIPNPLPEGGTIAIVGRGAPHDGIWGGHGDGLGGTALLTRLSDLPQAVVAGGLLTAEVFTGEDGPVPGPWFVPSPDEAIGQSDWGEPVNLSGVTPGSALTDVTMMVTAPNGYTLGVDGSGHWPLTSDFTIAFAGQTNPDNNGLYRGDTTDPEDPQPLIQIGGLPSHESLISASIFIATDEIMTSLPDDGVLTEEEMFSVLGPFLISWMAVFDQPAAWTPVSMGWGALIALINGYGLGTSVYQVKVVGSFNEDHTEFIIGDTSVTAEAAGALVDPDGSEFTVLNPDCAGDDGCTGVWTPQNDGTEEEPNWVWAKVLPQPVANQLVFVDNTATLWITSIYGDDVDSHCWRPVVPTIDPLRLLPSTAGADGDYDLKFVKSGDDYTISWSARPTLMVVPYFAKTVLDFSAAGVCDADIPYNSMRVTIIGTTIGASGHISFLNPGARRFARFTLLMAHDDVFTFTFDDPETIADLSDSITSKGYFEVIVVGQGTEGEGLPASVMITRVLASEEV